jgi:predicted aspartyl protease
MNLRLLTVLLLSISCFAQPKPSQPAVTFPDGADHVIVPFTDDRGHMVISVSLNGRDPQPTILDSGAQGAVLNGDAEVAKKYGITATEEGEVRGVGGKGAGVKALMAHDVTFELGGARLTGNEIAVVDRSLPGRTAQLVVGQSIFRNFVVQVDWDKHELTLFDPAKFKYKGGGSELPLEFDRGGRPYVHGSVKLDGKDVPVKLVIDTGAPHALSLLYGTSPDIKQPEHAEKIVLGRGASGELTGYLATTPALALGRYTVSDVPTVYPDESLGPVRGDFQQQGNLGSGILRRFTVVYDYPNRRIFVEPNTHLNDPFRMMGPPPKKAE